MSEADDLAKRFHRRMVGIYETAKREAGYNATYFLRMLSELGGVATAIRLVETSTPSDGFTQLWLKGRLDLTVEHLVLEEAFAPLFDDVVVEKARERLHEYSGQPGR